MDPHQQFCLKWNSYSSNLAMTFSNLFKSELLADVTLFCGGTVFKAHKLILAACSKNFAELFETAPAANGPCVVILEATSAENMSALLEFMYKGEVHVSQEALNSFLKAAENLQVKGLSTEHGRLAAAQSQSQAHNDSQIETASSVTGSNSSSIGNGGGVGGNNNNNNNNNNGNNGNNGGGNNGNSGVGISGLNTGGRQRHQRNSLSSSTGGLIGGSVCGSTSNGKHNNNNLNNNNQIFNNNNIYNNINGNGLNGSPSGNGNGIGGGGGGGVGGCSNGGNGGNGGSGGGGVGSGIIGNHGNGNSGSVNSNSNNNNNNNNNLGHVTTGMNSITNVKQECDSIMHPSSSGLGGFSSYIPQMYRPALYEQQIRKRHIRSPFQPQQQQDQDSISSRQSVLRDGSKGSSENLSPPNKIYRSPSIASTEADPSQNDRVSPHSSRYENHNSPSTTAGNGTHNKISSDRNDRSLDRNESNNGSNMTPEREDMLIVNKNLIDNGAEDLRMKMESEYSPQPTSNTAPPTPTSLISFGDINNEAGLSSSLAASIAPADMLNVWNAAKLNNKSRGAITTADGKKLKCLYCDRLYGYETNLRAHIRQRHQGIRVPCPFCERSFTRNNTVRRHVAREHKHEMGLNQLQTDQNHTALPQLKK